MVNDYKDKVKAYYDIILDSPWDTDQDAIETLMFLSKLPTPYKLNLFSLLFYPGTDLYRKAKKDGIIKDDVNDIYRKHYHGCQPSYLNDLHFLLNDYVSIDVGISPRIMSLLVNKKMRQLKISWILYKTLKMLLPVFSIIRNTQETLKDMTKGNWIKIWNQMKKWFLRKKARIKYEISLGFKKLKRNSNQPRVSVADDNQMGS